MSELPGPFCDEDTLGSVTVTDSVCVEVPYDGLNQLASFQRGTHQQTWDVDALGNFEGVNTDGTNQSRTHNRQNQLTVAGASTLTYDANGNLTTDETGRTFIWDAWNRPVTVNGTTRYAYDALGRRIKEGSTDLYYTTDWQVIEERNSSGKPIARYVWSPVYVDAMVLRDRDADANGSLEERLYVLADANYNVTALVNASGAVVERYLYDPYGRFDVKDAFWGVRASSSYAWVYLHQGGRWDATEAMYSFRHRDYSPILMRWASVDPIGLRAGDVNFYRYEGNHPTDVLDPFGQKSTLVGCARPGMAELCREGLTGIAGGAAGGAAGIGAGLAGGGAGAGAAGGTATGAGAAAVCKVWAGRAVVAGGAGLILKPIVDALDPMNRSRGR